MWDRLVFICPFPLQVCSSAVKTAFEVGAKMLVVLSETGTTARLISKYRPQMPILVLTAMAEVARQTNGYMRGVYSVNVGSMIGTESILVRAGDIGKEKGWVKEGDVMVAIHGIKEAQAGSTNLLKVLTVE